jgi:hypothetical protein
MILYTYEVYWNCLVSFSWLFVGYAPAYTIHDYNLKNIKMYNEKKYFFCDEVIFIYFTSPCGG